jgi:hypothetical protein
MSPLHEKQITNGEKATIDNSRAILIARPDSWGDRFRHPAAVGTDNG